MDRFRLVRFAFLAIALMWTGSTLMAQENETERDIQEELRADEEKAMQEMLEQEQLKQKQMQEEEMRARKEMLQQQQEQMQKLEQQYAERARELERQAREMARTSAPVIIGEAGIATAVPYVTTGSWIQSNQSQLTLRKTFRGTSSTSKGEFDVDEDIRQFRCNINGTVRSGEIVIDITYPDGKTFKELVINSSADINFSQSVSIKEGEEKKYAGTWKYEIEADDAEGNYMLQIMTN